MRPAFLLTPPTRLIDCVVNSFLFFRPLFGLLSLWLRTYREVFGLLGVCSGFCSLHSTAPIAVPTTVPPYEMQRQWQTLDTVVLKEAPLNPRTGLHGLGRCTGHRPHNHLQHLEASLKGTSISLWQSQKHAQAPHMGIPDCLYCSMRWVPLKLIQNTLLLVLLHGLVCTDDAL